MENTGAASSGVVGEEGAATIPEGDFIQSLRERLRRHEAPSHLGVRALVFLLSLGAFIYFMRETGPLGVAVIVATLLFHEAGHLVAMRLFGYQNLKIFFVPFMGAAVSGRLSRRDAWREAIVSLAGPVPGVVLGVALTALAPSNPTVRMVAAVLLIINGLNLLPFSPLDGGRVWSIILFSRHRYLELVGMVVGTIGLVATPGLLPGSPAIWAGALGGLLFSRGKMIDATHQLRALALELDGKTSELPTDSLVALDACAKRVLANTVHTDSGHVATMANLHDGAATRPARWAQALVLAVVWGAASALAWAAQRELKAPTLTARWERVTSSDARWSAIFPSSTGMITPPPSPAGIESISGLESKLGAREFVVMSVVLEDQGLDLGSDADDAAARMNLMVDHTLASAKASALTRERFERNGRPALLTRFQLADQRTVAYLLVASGNAVYAVIATGATPEQEQQFLEGFRVLR